jgi:hypothetical protein
MSKVRGAKVLGLIVLTSLVATAFSAATAQAFKWLVLGATITQDHTFNLSTPGGVILLMPAYNLELKCFSASGAGTMLSAGTKDVGHFKLSYTGCKVFSNTPLQELAACTASILPMSGTTLVIGSDLILFEPSTGPKGDYASIHLGGEGCAYNAEYLFGGTFRALVNNNNTAAPVFETKIAQGDDALIVGAFPVVLDAEIVGLLTTAGEVDKAFGVT